MSVDGRGKQAESFTFDLARYPYNLGYEIEPYMKEKYGFGISGKERLFGDELKAYNKAKSEIMNAFMTRLREATKGVKLMVRFEYDTIEKYGLDIEYWVKNGLVDVIIPGKISYEDFGDYSYYAKLVENTGVTLYGGITSDLDGQDLTAQEEQLMNSGVSVNIYNSTVNTEQYYTRAYRLYKLGCEKLYIFNNWNATDIPDDLGNKNAVYRYNLFKYPCDCVTSGAKFGEKLGDVTEAIIAQAYANSDDTPEDGINAVPVAVKWAIGIAAAAICAAAAVLLVLRKKRNKRI
ncbi:hypothetical protein SDC9_118552 [bioreactor metagenome]|uniref:Uncharacterized protein n=1 Tax=bioreactor metagenome TaxID=1076179 RepID=A0A645C8Z9_9ZZZZ